MKPKKLTFLLISFIFSWSLVGHALTCVGDNTNVMTEVSAEAIHASENCNNHNTPTSNTDNSTACSANCSVFHSFFLQAAQSQVLLDTSLVVNIPGYSFYYDQPVIGFEPFPPIQA